MRPASSSRETFQGQKTLFVLHLQESLTNLNALPHQFEIASGADAYMDFVAGHKVLAKVLTRATLVKVCMYVYCTYYAPVCHANGMEKASFARIVGAEFKTSQ